MATFPLSTIQRPLDVGALSASARERRRLEDEQLRAQEDEILQSGLDPLAKQGVTMSRINRGRSAAMSMMNPQWEAFFESIAGLGDQTGKRVRIGAGSFGVPSTMGRPLRGV